MDILGLVSVPTWLVVLLTILLSIYVYGKRKHSYFNNLGIPTLRGNTFMFGDLPIVSKRGFSYLDADAVKKNGKVFGIYIGNRPSLVVCDTTMIKEILVKQFHKFTNRSDLVPSHERWNSALNIAAGGHWKFLRSTLSPTFSSGKMRTLTYSVQQCLDKMHEILEEKLQNNPNGFDMAPLVKGLTMDVICNAGFGIEVNAQNDPENAFVKHARQFLEFKALRIPVFLIALLFPDLRFFLKRFFPTNLIPKDTFDFMKSATMSAFAARKEEGSNHKDLLQMMINAHKGESTSSTVDGSSLGEFKKRGLTDEEVLVNSIVFMSAGYDTTATALSWFVYDLVTNPEVQDKLFEEIDKEVQGAVQTYDNVMKLPYLDMVMNETLRMHPPATRYDRMALEDVEINGVQIKKGMSITFTPLAVHYMPEYWDNPKKYNPERRQYSSRRQYGGEGVNFLHRFDHRFAPENQANIDQYAFMPFGHGPRHCIAMRLAHLEIKMTIVSLLQKYRLVKTEDLAEPMPVHKGNFWKPDKPVSIKIEPRAPGH